MIETSGHDPLCPYAHVSGPSCEICDLIRQAEQRGIQKALIAWQEAEPLHDMEVLAAAVQRVEALFPMPDLPQPIRGEQVIAAIKGGSDE